MAEGLEYRVCWSADSCVTFKGYTKWLIWEDSDADAEQIKDEMSQGDPYGLPEDMDTAIAVSGFNWWVETRVRQV